MGYLNDGNAFGPAKKVNTAGAPGTIKAFGGKPLGIQAKDGTPQDGDE